MRGRVVLVSMGEEKQQCKPDLRWPSLYSTGTACAIRLSPLSLSGGSHEL